MSKRSILWTVIVIIIIILLVWAYMSQSKGSSMTAGENGTTTSSEMATGTELDTSISATNTSDEALTHDAASIDAQMNALDSDNSNADAGLDATTTE